MPCQILLELVQASVPEISHERSRSAVRYVFRLSLVVLQHLRFALAVFDTAVAPLHHHSTMQLHAVHLQHCCFHSEEDVR
jgi:hypothetical protein